MSSEKVAAPSGTRQRLDHVDAMRPIKQSAVISTHALIYFAPLSTSLLASGMLTLTHFSRDAFLFVSACMLAYSYRDHAGVQMGHYWRRRFFAVVLPYLVWTVIYFPIASMSSTSTFPYFQLSWGTIFSWSGGHRFLVALTTGYYHLYFLVVLIEFYIVFPFVFQLIRRFPRSHVGIVVGAFVFQFLYPIAVREHWFGIHLASKVATRLVISYPLYLLGGVIAALYLEKFHDWVINHWRGILAWTVVLGALPLVLNYLHHHGAGIPKIIVPGSDPFSPLVIPYDVGAIIAVYLLGVFLVSPQRSARTRAITKSGSDAAYGIYLSQMVWIIFLHRWTLKWGILAHVPWLVATLAAVVIAYLLGWLFSAVFARTPLARGLVGRTQVPWDTFWPHREPVNATAHDEAGEGPFDLTDD